MLKIKLARFGKKKQPSYRIVVNEARDKRDGRYVEAIGQYAPTMTPKILIVDVEAYQAWLKKGAQPTDTVAALVKRFEAGNSFPEKPKKLSKKAKAKLATETAATTAAEAVTTAPVETPVPVVEEVKAEESKTETAPEPTAAETEVAS